MPPTFIAIAAGVAAVTLAFVGRDVVAVIWACLPGRKIDERLKQYCERQ